MARLAPGELEPAWITAVGTGLAYLVLLAAMFVVLFVVPFLVFLAL